MLDRRYQSRSRGLTTFLALFDLAWLVAFIGSGYEHGYVIGWAIVTTATIVLALADWFIPRTVLTETGIHRYLTGSRRELAWSEVGGFAAVDRLVSPVDVLLAEGGSLPLRGVPATDVAELWTFQSRAVT